MFKWRRDLAGVAPRSKIVAVNWQSDNALKNPPATWGDSSIPAEPHLLVFARLDSPGSWGDFGALCGFIFDIIHSQRTVDRAKGWCGSGELAEETKVVTVEEADIFNAVLEHGDARRPQSKREPAVARRVVPDARQDMWMDHPSA